ncbi:peroxidase 7-like [Oryza brachyantha]|uniref:peroxidase 7-like n=1 Tax=Oryza brachyantha TaxID=4533 RepID=UPI001ADCD4F7|nr:peroxidase 7-like [Oryza brachyantha]
MARTPVALSLAAAAALLLLAVSAAAGEDGKQQQQEQGQGQGYTQPAYRQPVSGLQPGYYQQSCPDMEGVVQRAVKKAIAADYTLAPALLRLFFHDFAVGGVDASVLVDAPGSERYARASKTLRGFDLIDSIKKELEEKCPRTVSCADILAAAARDASAQVGVDYWQLAYGRKDGRKSSMVDADQYVPMGRESVTDLVAFFESRGLNVFDLVVLSGAHTVGRATCAAVRPRLCGYQGTGKPDAALDARYADFLRRKCRSGGGDDAYVELDAETPTTFDNRYYQNLLHGMGLLETDQKLLPDSRTGEFVRELAAQPSLFSHQFAKSMARIGAVQVLTGNEGEVRLKCSAINGH